MSFHQALAPANEPLQPLVSLIINNYNYASFLHQAIDSCLRQTYPKVEIIVVDDGSTDASPAIISSYGSRVTPIIKRNGGQASAMNAGFKISSGEIVIFLDADDYLLPSAVEEVINHWQPSIVQLQYRLNLVDQSGRFIDVFPRPDTEFHTGEVWSVILKNGRQQTTVTSGNAFSRAALEKVLPIPEADFHIAADGYLVSLVPCWGSVAAIEQILGAYRQHGSNLWSTSTSIASTDALLRRLHRTLQYDYHRYHWIRYQAVRLGYRVNQNLAFQDYVHLTNRLGSLRLQPQKHPFHFDSALEITAAGVKSVWRDNSLKWERKCITTLWFLATGLLPSCLATASAKWYLLSSSRPQVLQKAIKQVKALQRAFVPS